MASKDYSTVDDYKESEEMTALQNENAQLNLELCTLHTQCENLESENKGLKEEISNLNEKIKSLEDYIDKLEENDIIESTQINEIDILSNSKLQEEDDINILKHKIIELQKEIIRLSDNMKEDLINNENMQKEYESQIEILKNDIIALENENDQMREDITSVKEKCQIDLKNCFEEMSNLRSEKEESEKKFIEKLEDLNAIIKKYQNKIFEQENAYKELCDTSSKKLKETYDKFTNDIKNLKNDQAQFESIDNGSMEMTLEIHNLKDENLELKNNFEKKSAEFLEIQKKFNEQMDKQASFVKMEKQYKSKIKELEEENESLRADILNSSLNENTPGKNEDKEKKKESLIKENMEMKKENERLQKYIVTSEFRNAFAMKISFENKKLIEEINMYKKEIENLKNKENKE